MPANYTAMPVTGAGTQRDPLLMTNVYENPAMLTLSAETQLIGADLEPGQFTFQLLDNQWNQVATVTNHADGTIPFPGELVTAGGTSVYMMRQIMGQDTNITYDTAVYAAIVESALGADSTYALNVTYKKDGEPFAGTPLFVNRLLKTPPGPVPTEPSYTPITVPLVAQKQLVGGTLGKDQFTFQLKDAAGNMVSQVTNMEDGSIRFAPRTISREGVYLYHLSEVNDAQPSVVYDNSTYVARISVQARGGILTASVRFIRNGENHAGMPEFTNQFGTPETGDTFFRLPALLLLLSLALAGTAIMLTRRERRRAESR